MQALRHTGALASSKCNLHASFARLASFSALLAAGGAQHPPAETSRRQAGGRVYSRAGADVNRPNSRAVKNLPKARCSAAPIAPAGQSPPMDDALEQLLPPSVAGPVLDSMGPSPKRQRTGHHHKQQQQEQSAVIAQPEAEPVAWSSAAAAAAGSSSANGVGGGIPQEQRQGGRGMDGAAKPGPGKTHQQQNQQQQKGAPASGGALQQQQAANGGKQKQQQQQQPQQGKKKKARDTMIYAIHAAVKVNDLRTAMGVFRQATAQAAVPDADQNAAEDGGGAVPAARPFNLAVINSLMYVACGGEQWERLARGLPLVPSQRSVGDVVIPGNQPAEGSLQSLLEAAGAGGTAAAAAGSAGPAEAEGAAPAADAAAGGDGDGDGRAAAAAAAAASEAAAAPSREEHVAAMDELWSYMQSVRTEPDQGTYLSLARIEAVKGDAGRALHWAEECRRVGKPMQLRLFHPAQVRYCLAGDVPALERIDNLIASIPLDLTEYEYARLLEGVAAGGTYAQFKGVLQRIQGELNDLSPSTVDLIAAFFESSAAAAQAFERPAAAAAAATGDAADGGAGASGGAFRRWEVLRNVAMDAAGRCEAAAGHLQLIDLEDAEWDSFADSIADLARRQMSRSAEFDAYVEWYGRNGPYDILVDAANVAFFGQNHDGGGFCWPQIQAMYGLLQQRFPNKKILVMMHRKRLSGPEANTPAVLAFLDGLKATKSFYYTPPGANDDWYWMYAAVRARRAGLLVSNDELRDHIFSLLRPRHFLKWKERHISRFTYSAPGFGGPAPSPSCFELLLPRPYTACVQQLPNGAWLIPCSDGSWLCARPAA